jgi:hypothetical protein
VDKPAYYGFCRNKGAEYAVKCKYREPRRGTMYIGKG